MEGSGRITVPYWGYVEATLNIPEVKAFQEDRSCREWSCLW